MLTSRTRAVVRPRVSSATLPIEAGGRSNRVDTGRPTIRWTMSASDSSVDGAAGDQTAIAQDRYAVGERADLRHAVRNVDESHAFAAQLPNHAEEQLRLVVCQRRRRFVERQQAHAGPKRAHDLEQLPMRGAQGSGKGPWRQRVFETKTRQQVARTRRQDPRGREKCPRRVADRRRTGFPPR